MNATTVATRLLALFLPAAALVMPVRAANTAPASGAVIELPPMLVEESVSSVPWLYVNAEGTEFLSRCSAVTTRSLVEAWLRKMQLVRALIPEEFLVRMDVPEVFVLYAQDLKLTVSAEIQRQLEARENQTRFTDDARGGGVNIAPSMRLSDRDMHASIAYVDETRFDASNLSISPNHVAYLLRRRVPELPAWLVDGIERIWYGADFMLEPVTLSPLIWINQGESNAIARDRLRPRALLPANELFAVGALRAMESPHPRRAQVRTSTQALFFRWALLSDELTRDAFWKFAARAAEMPVTEELFEASFGFGFSELRDRLSDYLPRAVRETKRINPGRLPPLPRIEVERATPNEIARVRGEWERLAIGHVQRRLPEVREPYLVQARRTLRRAYEAGDRDPRLLATMGLVEVDAGNEKDALEFLEPAVALGVVRPRAYFELARIRFNELQQRAPERETFSFTELAPIIDPLRRASLQAPPLPEVFVLLAKAWERCELSPNAEELADLERGARLFAQDPEVGQPVALALARHGKKVEAVAVLDAAAPFAVEAKTRAAITGLRAELVPAAAPQPTGR